MASENEPDIIKDFLERHFGIGYMPRAITLDEEKLIEGVITFVAQKFKRSRYPMGLALDMSLLAQQLSLHDAGATSFRKDLTKEQILQRYTRVTARGDTDANTLTLTFNDGEAVHEVGIRKLEEEVGDLFVALKRPGYPSAYVYNTGQWHKYQDTLLLPAFRLSEAGRFKLCNAMIQFGLANLTKSRPLGREKPRVRLFEEIIRRYPRSRQRGERSGCVFQGIAAGYMKADRPHLYLIVDKTRTGSAKQDRIGDIDGYCGLDLEVSVEVKDMALTGANVISEIGEFLLKVVENRVMGLAFVLSADEEAVEAIRGHNAVILTQDDLLATVERWDWRKQDTAVQGLIHFLAHVEQNPDALNRLIGFIREHDPGHDSQAFYSVP
jgi:hypothetical protein